MITEEDNTIQLLVLPTRTVFTSLAQSVLAVFYNECISGRKVSFFKHRGVCSVQWTAQRPASRERVHTQHEERYNTQSRSLRPLHIGAEVRVQHPTTKKWDRVGVIIGIGQNRDYHVKLPSGRVYWRNRRFLRSSYGAPPNEDATNDEPDDIDHDGAPTCRFQPPDGPRRSSRRRMKPKTLNL